MLQVWPENKQIDPIDAYAPPADISQGFLRINMVSSIDGAISFEGRAKELSSDIDRKCFRIMRAMSDVILVGSSTAKIENYKPTAFDDEVTTQRQLRGQTPQAPIAIVTKSLDINWDSELFSNSSELPIIFTTDQAIQTHKMPSNIADVISCGESAVDLVQLKKILVSRGFHHILCEGGPTLNASLLAAGAIDELCLTFTPKLLQGSGHRIFNGPSLDVPQHLCISNIFIQDQQVLYRFGVNVNEKR